MKANPVGLWLYADFLWTCAPGCSGEWDGEKVRHALGQHLQDPLTVSSLSFGSSESFQKLSPSTGGVGVDRPLRVGCPIQM